METEKIMRARTTMQILLNAQEALQDLPVEVEIGEIVRQIDELIIGTAEKMDIAYGVSKKPETPYNCCDDCEFGMIPLLQKENAELKKQFEELRFEVGASLELINHIVHYTHRLLAEYPSREGVQNSHEVKNEQPQ